MNKKPCAILVVDDDPAIRAMMVDILDLEGYMAYTARNGQEALEKIRQAGDQERYLLFLDLMMPVMDGRELCAHLNADPELRARHVIVLMSALDRLQQAGALNVDATMPKPFMIDDMMRIIQTYCEQDTLV